MVLFVGVGRGGKLFGILQESGEATRFLAGRAGEGEGGGGGGGGGALEGAGRARGVVTGEEMGRSRGALWLAVAVAVASLSRQSGVVLR